MFAYAVKCLWTDYRVWIFDSHTNKTTFSQFDQSGE